jgi:hydrogenase nickel incorporation protein HypB
VVALSVTEGEDKPIKYPVMFQHADLVLITKCDLIPHLDVDMAAIHDALARVMPKPNALLVSARTGEGVDQFIRFLEEKRAGLSEKAAAAAKSGAAGHTHAHVHA